MQRVHDVIEDVDRCSCEGDFGKVEPFLSVFIVESAGFPGVGEQLMD